MIRWFVIIIRFIIQKYLLGTFLEKSIYKVCTRLYNILSYIYIYNILRCDFLFIEEFCNTIFTVEIQIVEFTPITQLQ